MAYLPMTQDVIKFMNKDFDKDNIISYQMLITLFGKLFANEKDFLNDPSDRMGLSHFVENFLRKNDFQTIVTIKDLNLIFNNNQPYDINDKELYKVFFVLIYEELSSNDPQISFKIKEAIFTLIDLLQAAFNDESEMILEETINEEIPQNIYEEENHWDIPEEKETQKTLIEEKNIIINDFEEKISNSFIIHNKKYLEEFIRRKNLIPYQCNICGLSEWQNEPLQLELDSLDGIYNNLNLNNLRFLCPNCYSQVGHFN